MNIVLGMVAALCYGVNDFTGGVSTRRADLFRVILVQQIAGLAVALGLVFLLPTSPHLSDYVFGALVGIGIAVVVKFYYAAMVIGDISVAAPVVAVVATTMSIGYGVALGELPSVVVMLGLVLAPVSVILITSAKRLTRRSYLDGLNSPQGKLCLAAGATYGLVIILLGQIRAEAGALPLVSNRVTSIVLVLALFRRYRSEGPGEKGWVALSLISGAIVMLGTLFFTMAAQRGPLEVPAALYSFTPAVVVVLSVVFLGEKLRRTQWLGVALVLTALVLIAVG